MKKILLFPIALIAFLFTFTACLEVEPEVNFPRALLSNITASATIVTPNDAVQSVTITAEANELFVDLIYSVHLEWTLHYGDISVDQPNAPMLRAENANNAYSTTIPGHGIGFQVTWVVVATTIDGEVWRSTVRTIAWSDVVQPGDPDPLAGYLLVFQAFGCGNTNANGVNRSFVELFNTTDEDIDLEGITLFWGNGIRGVAARAAGVDEDWNMIPLEGVIPASGSFLILHDRGAHAGARLQIATAEADMLVTMPLYNRSFKVALIRNSDPLLAQNPFNMDGNGAKAEGYIDMVGAANNPGHNDPDNIFGFEGVGTWPNVNVPRNSGSEAVRRGSLVDTDNNYADFVSIRYQGDAEGVSDDEVVKFRPRNSRIGSWTPTF